MGKRKLTGQQKKRIQHSHASHIQKAKKLADKVETMINENMLGAEQEGSVIARHGATVDIEDNNQKAFFCYIRQNIHNLVPGDRVIWRQSQENNGVVIAKKPRETVLERPDFHGHPKPIAANITQMMIVFAPKPTPSADLINKYLAAAELLQINPLLILNKVDLLPKKHEIHDWINIYQSLGYPVLQTSIKNPDNIKHLQSYLKNQTSIFLGQSGVGKSSLVRVFLPEEEIRISELSRATGFGKHTTSTARLYHIPTGGDLIDSPGVRNFTLWDISPQSLLFGFVECRPYIGQCKFSDCMHQHEPGCAILQLHENKGISDMRFTSLQTILKTM